MGQPKTLEAMVGASVAWVATWVCSWGRGLWWLGVWLGEHLPEVAAGFAVLASVYSVMAARATIRLRNAETARVEWPRKNAKRHREEGRGKKGEGQKEEGGEDEY